MPKRKKTTTTSSDDKTPPPNPFPLYDAADDLASYSKISAALRSAPELSKESNNTSTSPKMLMNINAGMRYFQDEYLGMEASKANKWPMNRIPDHLFHDRSPSGPLYQILLSALLFQLKSKSNAAKKLKSYWTFTNPKHYKTHLALMKHVHKDLRTHKFLVAPRVYLDDTVHLTYSDVQVGILEGNVLRFGGEVVRNRSVATHVVAYDVDADLSSEDLNHLDDDSDEDSDSDEDEEDEKKDAELPQKLYLRTITIQTPQASSSSKRKSGSKEDAMARVHWWFYPSSYDEWIPASDVNEDGMEEEGDEEKGEGGCWYVNCRFLRDVARFNEWGVEADYIIADYKNKVALFSPPKKSKMIQQSSSHSSSSSSGSEESSIENDGSTNEDDEEDDDDESISSSPPPPSALYIAPPSPSTKQAPSSESGQNNKNKKQLSQKIGRIVRLDGSSNGGMCPKSFLDENNKLPLFSHVERHVMLPEGGKLAHDYLLSVSHMKSVKQFITEGMAGKNKLLEKLLQEQNEKKDEEQGEGIITTMKHEIHPSEIVKPSRDKSLGDSIIVTELTVSSRGAGKTIAVNSTLPIVDGLLSSSCAMVKQNNGVGSSVVEGNAESSIENNAAAVRIRGGGNNGLGLGGIERTSGGVPQPPTLAGNGAVDIQGSSSLGVANPLGDACGVPVSMDINANEMSADCGLPMGTVVANPLGDSTRTSILQPSASLLPTIRAEPYPTNAPHFSSVQEKMLTGYNAPPLKTSVPTNLDSGAMMATSAMLPAPVAKSLPPAVTAPAAASLPPTITAPANTSFNNSKASAIKPTPNPLSLPIVTSINTTPQPQHKKQKTTNITSASIETIPPSNVPLPPMPLSNPTIPPKTEPKNPPPPLTNLPSWYKPTTISPLEKTLLPEWFNLSAPHRTPKTYLSSRDAILRLNHADQYLTATLVRRKVPGDAGSLLRLHAFMDTYGLIHYGVGGEGLPRNVHLMKRSHEDTIKVEEKKEVRQNLFVSRKSREELARAVVRHSKRRKWTNGDTEQTGNGIDKKNENAVDWKAVAQSVGNNITAEECQNAFLSISIDELLDDKPTEVSKNSGNNDPMDDAEYDAAFAKRDNKLFENINRKKLKEEIIRELLDGANPQVISAATNAALKATNDLKEAQKAGIIGVIAGTAAEQSADNEKCAATLLLEVLDERMKKLENRVMLLDDVEAMLEAERVSLEIERRDLYMARCCHWNGNGNS